MKTIQNDSLKLWEKLVLGFLLGFFIFFLDVVLIRSAFLSRVMGDADVFFRAGWAVRSGKDIYDITDPNGWHYNYPPLFAITMAPLGDPPPGESRSGFLPYPVSIGILYKISFLSLILGVFIFAGALEKSLSKFKEDWPEKKWYYLRFLPVIACLSPIGHNLMRGQVNLFLLCLVCLGIAFQLKGKKVLSGIFIALAICLKIIPAFLLIVPAWRKDFKQMAGCVAGLFLGVCLIPASVLGLEKTKNAYVKLYSVLISPALGLSEDSSRGVELNNMNSTDNQSLLAFLHGIENPDLSKKPPKAAKATKIIYLSMSFILLFWLLWVKGLQGNGSKLEDAHFLSLAFLLMVIICPTSHSPYYLWAIPLIMTSLVFNWIVYPNVFCQPFLLLGIVAYCVANALPLLPQLEVVKRMGVCVIPNLILFSYGVYTLGKMKGLIINEKENPSLSVAA